jgi:anti-sigma factor RsiW
MSEAGRHRHIAELIPWYVNGTLEGRDRDAVTAHLSDCLTCREEVAQCQTLAAAVQVTGDSVWAPDPDRLGRLLASIERLEATDAQRAGWRARWRTGMEWIGDLFDRTPGIVRWGLAAQAALLVLVVGLALWPGAFSPRAPYRTLAENGPNGDGRIGVALIHVVFADDITERDMRTLLGRVRGKIVDGPTAVGLYTVEVRAQTPDQIRPMVTILRDDPKVRLAEPVARR